MTFSLFPISRTPLPIIYAFEKSYKKEGMIEIENLENRYSKESSCIFSGNLDASLNGDDDDDFMGLEEFDPTVEVYECDTDRWRYLSPLPNGAGRSQHAATSINDSKV